MPPKRKGGAGKVSGGEVGGSGQTVGGSVSPVRGELGGHKCVMCDETLPSKAELQDHFRLHANGQINLRGKSTDALKQVRLKCTLPFVL